MIDVPSLARTSGVALMLLGGITLMSSFAVLVVYPEAEMSAFPFPLGVPGMFLILVGALLSVLSRIVRPQGNR